MTRAEGERSGSRHGGRLGAEMCCLGGLGAWDEADDGGEGREETTSLNSKGRLSIKAERSFDKFSMVTHWSEEDINSL